jgi:Raf kinase inhibitor-like YbhB/YbcL family protein
VKEAPVAAVKEKFSLSSSAFADGERIPKKYTCQGPSISPPLHIEGIPEGAESLVLIMHDPDAPRGDFEHWTVWNIPLVSDIAEGTYPKTAVQGLTDSGKHEYSGPCPPSGTHRYFFDLYAISSSLDISHNSQRLLVLQEIEDRVIARASLIGTYSKE